MARKERPLTVKTPGPDGDKPKWGKIGIFAVAGLVIGIAWPSLAGVRIGPSVPGADKAKAAPASTASTTTPVLSNSAQPTKQPVLAKAIPTAEVKPFSKQTVVVEGGRITRCYKGSKRLKPEECGTLKVDRVLAPRMKQLDGCPSALGLAGGFELGFDINFVKKEVSVQRGERRGVPATTVNGIIACTADYIRDVDLDKIPHKYSRYRVFYDLKFYPAGTAPPTEGADDPAAGDSDERGLASVSWDTALVRREPRNGKIIARLVRGTRVKILSRRKDWYRIKIRTKEGWVYRGALGL